jgi:hypothetical protein
MSQGKYKMTIGVNVLKHLGLNLYSNLPAVLTEVVANAWDADATEVNISIDDLNCKIEISDNGIGMTLDDVNKKFLHVGYEKRRDITVTPRFKRKVMGRKGIGKLSLFSIANNIEVFTSKDNEKHAFLISRTEIDRANENSNGEFYPETLPTNAINFTEGTKILLTDLTTPIQNITNKLRKNLSKRFSVLDKDTNFVIKINDVPITLDDKEYYKDVQFLWYLGEESLVDIDRKFGGKNVLNMVRLNNVVDEKEGYRVTGWVGTFLRQPNAGIGYKPDKQLENVITLYANGRVIQEDMLNEFKENMFYAQYLVGEIEADFLDLTDKPDIATSDRQRIKQDDIRYTQLKTYIYDVILLPIRKIWGDLRKKHSEKEAMKNPQVREWHDTLTPANQELAKEIIGKVESLVIDSENKAEVYKTSILAFETLTIKGQTDKIKQTFENLETQKDFDLLKMLFDSVDQLEAVSYYHIVRKRLQIIKEFEKILPTAKEQIIQKYLFDHLWLLHPSWEKASTNPRIEQAIKTEFADIDANLTEDEKKGRVDIRYRTAAGKHIIIELKKYDKKVLAIELVAQVDKYRKALSKCLDTKFPNEPKNIETICIIGTSPEGNPEENQNMLKAINARYLTYDSLIAETLNGYQDYLEVTKNNEKLIDIITKLEDSK